MLKPTILLDKSYLQGSKVIDIQQLAKSHQLLMADVLFYELISSAEPGRSRCFAKLRRTETPVVLVKNFGALLKQEIHSHRACGKPSTHYEDTRFRFEEELASADYQMPPEAAETMEKEAEQLRHDVASLLSHVARFPR